MGKLVYISGKYGDLRGVWYQGENIRKAHDVAVELLKAGIAFHCPHLNTAYMDGLVPWQDFITMDLTIVDHCDGLVMVENWTDSKGAMIEHARGRLRGLPIFYWPQDREKLLEWASREPDDFELKGVT